MFAIELLQELIEANEPADQWVDASCQDEAGSLTELFFSDQIPDIVRAKRICATCPRYHTLLGGCARAPRAMGRMGWSAVPQREGAGPEAPSGTASEESSARGRHPVDGIAGPGGCWRPPGPLRAGLNQRDCRPGRA